MANKTTAFGQPSVDGSSVSAILTVLDIVVDQLNDISSDVETSVVGVCNGFQGMSTRARSALSHAAEVLDSSGDGGLPACVHRIRMSLNTITCRLQSMREFSNTLSDRIGEIDDRLAFMVRLGEKMIEISKETRVAVNKSVAGIRRIRGGSSAAEPCLEPVEVMTQAALQCGQAICSLVASLRTATKECSQQAKQLVHDDNHSLESRETTIRDSLDHLNSAYERMSASLSSSAAMNRQLNNDIGQAVMSMQFQDRVNQRIQHIVETITELARDLRPLANNADPETLKMITKLWTDRLSEKSTMAAERTFSAEAESSSDSESTVDLF